MLCPHCKTPYSSVVATMKVIGATIRIHECKGCEGRYATQEVLVTHIAPAPLLPLYDPLEGTAVDARPQTAQPTQPAPAYPVPPHNSATVQPAPALQQVTFVDGTTAMLPPLDPSIEAKLKELGL